MAKFTGKLWFNIAITAYCKYKQFCPFKMNFSSVACYKKTAALRCFVCDRRYLVEVFTSAVHCYQAEHIMFETGSPLGFSCKATLCKLAHAYASTYLNTHTHTHMYVCFTVYLYPRINIYVCMRVYILFVDHMLKTPCHTRNTYH